MLPFGVELGLIGLSRAEGFKTLGSLGSCPSSPRFSCMKGSGLI